MRTRKEEGRGGEKEKGRKEGRKRMKRKNKEKNIRKDHFMSSSTYSLLANRLYHHPAWL